MGKTNDEIRKRANSSRGRGEAPKQVGEKSDLSGLRRKTRWAPGAKYRERQYLVYYARSGARVGIGKTRGKTRKTGFFAAKNRKKTHFRHFST